jgi:hypothetical protein
MIGGMIGMQKKSLRLTGHNKVTGKGGGGMQRKIKDVDSRIRTCAGRAQQISSLSP